MDLVVFEEVGLKVQEVALGIEYRPRMSGLFRREVCLQFVEHVVVKVTI